MNPNRPRGTFTLHRPALLDTEMAQAIFAGVVVWRTEHHMDRDQITFHAEHPDFDPIPEYSIPPQYQAVYEDGVRRWERVAPTPSLALGLTEEEIAALKLTALEAVALEGLRAAMKLAHKTATDAGWYVDPATGEQVQRNFGEVVALMHSELSEALEADRKGLNDDKLTDRDGREVEFADVILRILDTAGAMGMDVPGAFIAKNRFNAARADHKLENRAAAGGKRY
ncbi:hypothetical protein LCM08_06335 [Salipiger pacificus]|nr:hypothetical protein [Alloyangia pacifica]